MTLARGTRLGPYEGVVPLWAGGMGEVYRPRDVFVAGNRGDGTRVFKVPLDDDAD